MDIKLVESIKQLIAEGKTENAITQSLDNIHDDELKNDLIVISGKFQKIKREENIGIEGYDKISQEKNKINSSLLEVLNSIKIDNKIEEDESEELKNLKIKIQEKINGLYSIDTEYWGQIIKINENTLVVKYNPFKYSHEGIITFRQYWDVFKIDIKLFFKRIPIHIGYFILIIYVITFIFSSLGYGLPNIEYDYLYIFGLCALFILGHELIFRIRSKRRRIKGKITFETTDEVKIDLKTGIITKSRTERKIRGLFKLNKTVPIENQIQYLDKSNGIGCLANYLSIRFEKGKKLNIGFFQYDKEAIRDFVELIESVANHFSIHNPIEVEAYYSKDDFTTHL